MYLEIVFNSWFLPQQSIEKELLERLKKGVYGDIYNYPVKEYNKVLDLEELEVENEDEEVWTRNFDASIHHLLLSLCLFLDFVPMKVLNVLL